MAGFQFARAGAVAGGRAPLVLLHGSGGSEDSLRGFAQAVAPDRPHLALRGPLDWEGGHAFFRRNPDRTLDRADLAAQAGQLCGFLAALVVEGHPPPLLLGYSNGAIMATAALLRGAGLSAGAVLLRPLSPCAGEALPPLDGYPALLLGAVADARRDPGDTPQLAGQLLQAGALVTARLLPGGHALGEADAQLTRGWLAGL
ncbi:hypothetical protein BKE38_23820 [Pseudoroseomonas deserti]|uniref:Esterase n=1 Tax=Teichococcus deserti TaxID=1817963 RepID=A0A1V2GYI9_9PROT|nr:hypothetical protein BKE38_23820 [Pseudoroseomonas deserti]